MKKSTKSSLIIFIVVAIVSYVTMCLMPEDMFHFKAIDGSLLSFLGKTAVQVVGLRGILSIAISTVVVLLVRIVDTTPAEEKKTAKKKEAK